MQALRSTVDVLRDRLAPISHTSTFRSTGQITPEEFLAAGDYLVYKFPSWAWASAATPSQRVSYLPADKQYLVTRGVPCRRRLDAHFAGGAEEQLVQDGAGFERADAADAGWLSTGGEETAAGSAAAGGPSPGVQALGASGEVEIEDAEEEEIPDMEDDDDDAEAIIPEGSGGARGSESTPLRTYNLYITYTPYYRTPRLYLSGYARPSPGAAAVPLPPAHMLEDIVGDYKDKTVTLEDFPFFDSPVKTASVHPCRHASVMKVLLDRADAALQLRRERLKRQPPADTGAGTGDAAAGVDALTAATDRLQVGGSSGASEAYRAGAQAGAAGAAGAEEWEVLQHESEEDEAAAAIRVDQYVVVFLKFMASVTPGIEHDFTMGV